ncbi:hypothetical protein NKH70_11120 [Mesorhizobium sp. M0991]
MPSITIETDGAQLVGDVERIVDGIGQRAGFGVAAVAYHKRYAPRRLRIRAQQQKAQKRQCQDHKPAHRAGS